MIMMMGPIPRALGPINKGRGPWVSGTHKEIIFNLPLNVVFLGQKKQNKLWQTFQISPKYVIEITIAWYKPWITEK